jgi:hypothetical protein
MSSRLMALGNASLTARSLGKRRLQRAGVVGQASALKSKTMSRMRHPVAPSDIPRTPSDDADTVLLKRN